MALYNTSIIWKVNIGLQVLALIICLTGFASNYLVIRESGSYERYAGLWKYCEDFDTLQCWDLTDRSRIFQLYKENWVKASRAMMSISLIIHFSDIIGTLSTAFFNTSKMIVWALAVIEFIAALFGIVGVAVACGMLKKTMEDKLSLDFSTGWSFVLFLVSQFAFIAAGLLHLLDARMKYTSHPAPYIPSPTPQELHPKV